MTKKVTKIISLILVVCLICFVMSGCAWLENEKNELKGSLKGVSYNAEFYDNSGNLFLKASGTNIDITGNKVEETGYDSEGYTITTYNLSSAITVTIDGKEMVSCGDTVIFAESGLNKDVDFTLNDISSQSDGSFSEYTVAAKIVNRYKNLFGKPMVVVIQSQLGVPICVYSGNEVYWEVCQNLPKTTKLMIDGHALYIHRANFQIIDKELIK